MKHPSSPWVRMFLVALVSAGPLSGGSQVQRDPTVAPAAEAGSSLRATGAPPTALESDAFSIIVRDGKPSLVVGTRLYAVGQTLAGAKIERITETEVWLREGKVLKKLSQFSGIERRATVLSASPSGEAGCHDEKAPKVSPTKVARANSSKTAPRVASCADDQP